MDAYKVEKVYAPKLSFGVSLELTKNNDAILSLVVRDVRPNSDAAMQGVVPRTRIYKIDGVPLEQMKATFLPGSDLGRYFVDRKNGDQIILEIARPGDREPRLVVIKEFHFLESPFVSLMERGEN